MATLAYPARKKQGSGSATRRMLAERAVEMKRRKRRQDSLRHGKVSLRSRAAAVLYERHHKTADKSDSKLPSIIIKNVLPGPHNDIPMQTASPSSSRRLVIPGFCDTAVEEYSEWQMSRVKRDDLREGVLRIRDIALKDGLDLVQIHQDQDPDYITKIEKSVQAGVAKRFVREIPEWVEQYQGNDGSDILSVPEAFED
ncbi:hypothetical protein T440DRAFT_522991 [Plenodomus tracheiphilus IPT5]|uniref:Uncharacterized protein n=1 Tax=Plenodomus tracheiphilus IPT5 TaxID=1408161 RepID=A0A6A7AP36_9PLEO|nr:hypothetical protein T440DRAFT_522991 [Plenodomus tracheiphilus IPT5]